jgi:hypothetical protein
MKITVAYEHDSADFDIIEMAVGDKDTQEPLEGWKAVYRDTINGMRVVWARFEQVGYVWLRDRNGTRRVTPMV